MKCHNCGSEIPEQSVFCGMCGARVKPDAAAAAPVTPTVESVTEPKIDNSVTNSAEPITEPGIDNSVTIPAEPVTEPEPTVDEPVPAEPITEPAENPAEPVTEPEPEVNEPITEPEIDNSVTNPAEPVAEPEPETDEPVAEPETAADNTAAGGTYSYGPQTNPYANAGYGGAQRNTVMRHCTYCGAVLMDGAKFCSNCGNYVTAYEPPKRKKGVGKLIAAIAAVIALIAVISGITYAIGGHDIEGEWVVENNNDMFGSMFGESYLDFDDGTALYYNGLFNAQRYTYSYNRFTKILTLQGKGTDEYTRVHTEWHGNNTVFLPELDMTITRIDDIPYEYSDDEYDSDDVFQF